MVLRDEGIVTDPREIYLREGQPTPALLKAIFDRHGVPIHEDRLKLLVERRREYDFALGERRFFEQVPNLLKRIRMTGCRSGMVTGSSKKSVRRVLTEDQAGWFDVIITADDVTHPKPNPEPFLLAAARDLNLDPKKCLVIENAPFGIEAALSAGCRVVALCSTLSAEDLRRAHWVVRYHDELDALLFGEYDRAEREELIPCTGGVQ
jgi:beta-phosphoglucomutase